MTRFLERPIVRVAALLSFACAAGCAVLIDELAELTKLGR